MFNHLSQRLRKKLAFSLIELSIVILIIGIIIAGIVGGNKLVTLSNLTKARQLTNSSPVNGIEDLALWLETTSKNSFPTTLNNGDSVTAWNDINPQLSLKKNFINAAYPGGAIPSYTSNAINGLPAMAFNMNSCMVSVNSISYSDTAPKSQITIFMVGSNALGIGAVFIAQNSSLSNRIGNIEIDTNRLRFNMVSTALTGTSSVVKPSIMMIMKNSSQMIIYKNGALDASVANSSTVTPSTAPIYVGCLDPSYGYSVAGFIGEVIIYNRAISDFERQQVEQYLSKKWGIPLN